MAKVVTEPVQDAIALKLAISWVGGAVGTFTLSTAVLIGTLIFTIVQIFFTLRDKWWRERPSWIEKHGKLNERRK